MNISEKISQQQLQEILQAVISKGNQYGDLKTTEVIEDIEQRLIMILRQK